MHVLAVAAGLILMAVPALAIDSSGTSHLEHIRHTGLGTPVLPESH